MNNDSDKCDNKAVGMLVWKDSKLLFEERNIEPYGFAPPAGHVDSHGSFKDAAIAELEEEVGLEVKNIELIKEERRENKCGRKDGNWHYWKIYKVKSKGSIKIQPSEVKSVKWLNKKEIKELSKKTEKYLNGEISKENWIKNPGIEPVWYKIFKELEII